MKRNNGKWRRELKASRKVRGPSGAPHPVGPRWFRRSRAGKIALLRWLEQQA